jgi:hypothetical protein
MSAPKAKTVNVVTMEHGIEFVELWFSDDMTEACHDTGIIVWPDYEGAEQDNVMRLEDDICESVHDSVKQFVAETFVRIANSVIEGERRRADEPLSPPRVETVELVTTEHAELFAEEVKQRLIDSADLPNRFR